MARRAWDTTSEWLRDRLYDAQLWVYAHGPVWLVLRLFPVLEEQRAACPDCAAPRERSPRTGRLRCYATTECLERTA